MILDTTGLKDAQKSKLKKINEVLGTEVAESDVYTSADAVPKILDYLALKEYKPAYKIQYLTVVSGLLSKAGLDNAQYRSAMSALRSEKKTAPVKDMSEACRDLEFLISQESGALSVLAGVLWHNIPVTMTDVVGTTVVDMGGVVPYLDLEKCVWYTATERSARRGVEVPAEFAAMAKKIAGKRFLLERNEFAQYPDMKQLSALFKEVVGCTYMEVQNYQRSLKKGAVKVEVKAKPKKLVKLRDEYTVDYRSVCQNFEGLRKVSVDKYVRNINKLQELVLGSSDVLLVDRMCSEATYKKVLEVVEGMNPHSVYSMLSPMSRVLEQCKDRLPDGYRWYHDLAMKYKLLAEQKKQGDVPDFEVLLEEMKRIYNGNITKSLRVILLIALNSVGNDDRDIGILRISDIIHTKIGMDDEYSYVDLEEKVWVIRGAYTKNKRERKLQLPQGFLDGLKEIYDGKVSEWLVTTERGEKHKTSASLSDIVITHLHTSWTQVRASYATYLYRNFPINKGEKMAHNMGHSYHKSVFSSYLRAPMPAPLALDEESVGSSMDDDSEDNT